MTYDCFRRVMILLEVTVLASGLEIGNKIGNPQALRSTGGEQNAQMNTCKFLLTFLCKNFNNVFNILVCGIILSQLMQIFPRAHIVES